VREGNIVKPTIGFIGLGLMGRPMALNLLKEGFPVVAWNRTLSKTTELVAAGAKAAASPREAAAAADVLITIVSDPPALESVLFTGGTIESLRRGSVLIDSSTVSPALARRAATACRERSVEFLDAPVTGGTWGAEKGELVFMVGGEAATLARVEPVLASMGKKWFHLGPAGAGQTVKLAMNLLLALEVQAFSEALALVTSAGVPAENLVSVMQASMGRAPVLDVKAPVMLKQDYKPSFPLRLMHKDINLAMDLADQLGVKLPAGAAAKEVYGAVMSAAKEDLDYAAVAKYWQKA
jgi:3-hydroxyisobutyrate dehydrogenase-like beta-hydroxyacid dehydrogenase